MANYQLPVNARIIHCNYFSKESSLNIIESSIIFVFLEKQYLFFFYKILHLRKKTRSKPLLLRLSLKNLNLPVLNTQSRAECLHGRQEAFLEGMPKILLLYLLLIFNEFQFWNFFENEKIKIKYISQVNILDINSFPYI